MRLPLFKDFGKWTSYRRKKSKSFSTKFPLEELIELGQLYWILLNFKTYEILPPKFYDLFEKLIYSINTLELKE